jgi:hypothetical protein
MTFIKRKRMGYRIGDDQETWSLPSGGELKKFEIVFFME